MSVQFFWTLPANGDGRGARRLRRGEPQAGADRKWAAFTDGRQGAKYTSYDYLFQVARSAESAGFDGALIPWNAAGDDPWIVASSLAREARKLTFLPELEPAFATPVYLAKMSASFQRLARDRLAWKFDAERDASVRRALGDFGSEDEWIARADEYLTSVKGVWTTKPFNFRGHYYDIEAGGLDAPLSGRPLPTIYTSGNSAAAFALAGKHADFHFVRAGTLDAVRSQIERLDAAGVPFSRQADPALHLAIVARPSDEEAWNEVRLGWDEAVSDSDQSFEQLSLGPHLWSGFDRIGFGTNVGLVGSYKTVADTLEELTELGIVRFILGAAPHVEEAYRIGEHVFSRLPSRTNNLRRAV
jgi:alkanesulfonate monooxygenase